MNDAIFDGHTVGASRHGRDAEGRALATMLCATHREEPLYLARTIGLKNCVFFENEANDDRRGLISVKDSCMWSQSCRCGFWKPSVLDGSEYATG